MSAREVLKSWWCASKGGNICSEVHLAECGACSVCADDILAALSAAGFVIVPREPTNKMLQAHPIADLLPAEAVLNRRREVYRAMLSAAEGKK